MTKTIIQTLSAKSQLLNASNIDTSTRASSFQFSDTDSLMSYGSVTPFITPTNINYIVKPIRKRDPNQAIKNRVWYANHRQYLIKQREMDDSSRDIHL